MRRKTASLIFHWVWAAVLFAAVVFIIVGVSLGADGRRASSAAAWDWSPIGVHHRSAVKVVGGGSGTYVQHGDLTGILTARHVVDGAKEKTVVFADGSKATGLSWGDKFGYDIGFIVLASASVTPLTIASEPPKVGERVECISYGGENARLRHWWSRLKTTETEKFVWYKAPITAGDSGGTIVNERREVVGVQAVGRPMLTNRGEWPVYDDAGSAPHEAILGFLNRMCERDPCPEGGCPEGGCPQPGPPIGGGGGWQFYPPETPLPKAPPLPPEPDVCPQPLPTPPLVQVDQGCRDQLRAIKDRMDRTDKRLDGLVATDQETIILLGSLVDRVEAFEATPGPPGNDGADAVIDYDLLATEVAKRLPPIYVKKVNTLTGKETIEEVYLGEGLIFQLTPHE